MIAELKLIQLQKPPLPPVPTGHFIVAKELLSPSSIPCSVNQGQLWANSLRSHATARGERLASKDEDKKHLQWDVVSGKLLCSLSDHISSADI